MTKKDFELIADGLAQTLWMLNARDSHFLEALMIWEKLLLTTNPDFDAQKFEYHTREIYRVIQAEDGN